MRTDRKKLSDKLDKLVSEKIRSIGRCERCGKTTNLQCCHIYGRSNKWLRWDMENLLCLCAGCHLFWWHREPAEAVRWAMSIKNFDYLDGIKRQTKPMKQADMEEIFDKLKKTFII